MASMETKREKASPFTLRARAQRKTSAEIVKEARQSLRTLCTKRPFTPRDDHRQLFGESSVRANRDSRPPSTFSLHARNFDAPDSRPGSGTRLSPLDNKPKLPAPYDTEEPVSHKALPKPPSDPLEVRRGVTGARARLLRAGSLTTLPPAAQPTDEKDRLSADSRPKPSDQSAKGEDGRPPGTDPTEAHRIPLKPGPRRTASESGIRRADGDSPTEQRPAASTGLGNGDSAAILEEAAESWVWNNKIVPLMQDLESMAAGRPVDSVDRLCNVCERLHGVLAEQGMLGRRCKKRAGLLRMLFSLIDLNSAQLNLQLAKLCLGLCVSGNNLLNICKLVFKISRTENNDILFQNNSIIDSLLGVLSSEDVCASGEALLYCVGTLKFLSSNSALLRLLLAKNCMGVAQQLIQRLHLLSKPGHAHFTAAGHILVQLTATLRNLADLPESRPLFVSHAILSELCLVLRHHHGDQDICTNIARIYSKLSSYSECRLALAQTPGCCQLFIELLSKHQGKQDLVVRLLFTLGNLTSKSNEARELLFQSEGCVDTLLQLYHGNQRRVNSHTPHTHPDKDLQAPCKPRSPPGSVREADDVLVKLVRVLANMCIHPAIGPALAANTACVQLLMETLVNSEKASRDKDLRRAVQVKNELRSMQESEELLVNVAATINNLSFYQGASSVVKHKQLTIAKLMLRLLLSSSMDAVHEATRVYGNLSQSRDVRDFIMQNKVYQFLVTLLDSKNCEVCFSACGVITNLALDPPNRTTLSLEGATAKLADCLRDFGPVDWQLAGLVCQTLWKFTEQAGSERGPLIALDTQEGEALLEILTTYIDEEEALQWTASDDMTEFHRACWELEFLPVAQKLKNRLQSMG